jgi:hypothetical protein
VNALGIVIQYGGHHAKLVGGLDFVQIVDVQLEGVERAVGAFPVGRVEPQVVHDLVDRGAQRDHIISVAQMSVVVDPVGRECRAERRELGHVRAQ